MDLRWDATDKQQELKDMSYSFALLPGPVKGVTTLPKTNIAREPPIFTCYVSFREGSWLDDGRDQLLVDDGNDG